MGDLPLIGIPAGLALVSLILALTILRLVARRRGPGRAGAMVSGVSCLVLAGCWAFVAGFHAITG